MNGVSRREFAVGAGLATLFAASGTPVRASTLIDLSSQSLERFRQKARDLGVRALVVANSTHTILSDGAVAEPSRIASIRKSILSALYGMAVAEGRANLDVSLGELGVDDYQSLTDLEKSSTIRNLLQARSGVYIPSSAETPAMKAARPARGSHAPGGFWYYNNWDFNVLGEIYQRVTGESLFTAIEYRLARPLGWRDFDPLTHMRWGYDPEFPRFPAYNMWMSARDLARFGQLFLCHGRWNGRQILPQNWVAESMTPFSVTGRTGWRSGYGYMWWVASERDGASSEGLPAGAYTAAGNGGRYVTIFPDHDLVIAIQPDEKEGAPPVELYADADAYTNLLRLLFRS